MISLAALSILVYAALGLTVLIPIVLLTMVFTDYKKGELW